jgi:KaiC/GvpD/RAD55 family RecA-like ATPase
MEKSFEFREDFQDLLLACMMREGEHFIYVAPAIKPKYFTGVQPTLAAECMLDYWMQYLRFPAWEVLEQLLDEATRQMPDADTNLAIEYMRKLRRMDVRDWEYVRARVSDFVRERAIVDTIKQSVALIQDGKIPADGFTSMFAKAMQVGRNLEDLGYILDLDVDAVVGKVMNVQYGLRTGFTRLDEVWRHGWAPGWLIIPAAPPKRYKTGFCVNLAMNVISPDIGEDVIYYACEISQELAMVRAMSHLSELSEDVLYESPAKYTEAVRAALKEKVAAHLLFKSFPSKTATIADLRAHAHMAIAQLGIKPRLIIIDYAETVQPSDRKEAEYRQQSSIYTEARAFGGELGATVVMPDRVKADYVNQPTPDMRCLQGAFEKAGILDGAFALCATDEEYLQRCQRLFVFLNRHGAAYQHFRGRVDPTTWHMTFSESVPFDPSAAAAPPKELPRRRGSRASRGPPMPSELTEDR